MGREDPVGTLALVPNTIVSESDGVVRLKADVVFDGLDGIGAGMRLLDGPTNIQFGLTFNTLVQPFPGVSFTAPEDEKCGVQIDVAKDKTGEMVCGDSYDKLNIPPINRTKDDEPMKLGASAKDLEDASRARDKYLGMAQAIGYSL